MFVFLSVITSVKDYIEIVHKLVESNSSNSIQSYQDLGAILTFILLSGKEIFVNFFSFNWFLLFDFLFFKRFNSFLKKN